MTAQEITNETWRLRKMKDTELSKLILQEDYIHTPILKRVIREKIDYKKNQFWSPVVKKLWNKFVEAETN